jgi:hypothetical protein
MKTWRHTVLSFFVYGRLHFVTQKTQFFDIPIASKKRNLTFFLLFPQQISQGKKCTESKKWAAESQDNLKRLKEVSFSE